ncbi:hypothetical protein ORI89_07270 [Sphingobacterium sp. UT-1RO-CII-1]|uniref:DUF6965 family protein n=1 Tax=Sphingobacterium sp. UT-1RO-CII-1 TaxID=2995225 RepID=UPI00227CF8AA|nr:hypothetical protein [Sphingobacterium sp. UT-1RO-CII-1]MCY4779444.1 hypothetical protein [Sphingobacterium sp. UT-1RO-CII-1]
MTVEELKTALLNRDFPETVKIDKHQVVSEVDKFLKIQFIEIDIWKKEIIKSPAYLRLLAFHEAVR